jgi:hypothetical protein
MKEFLGNITVPKLSRNQADSLEGVFTFEETLKNMKNDKSLGSDGFTSIFFWKQIGHFVVRSINYFFIKGELSLTRRQGIITCFQKENKPNQYFKNWRPITLLNYTLKLASGT